MQFWTALMIGFAGSLHCAGMCGPLILAMPAASGGLRAHLAGKLAYNAGRIITYALMGSLFGVFGQLLGLAGFQRWISICIGAVLIISLVAWPLRRMTVLIAQPVGWLKTALGRQFGKRTIGSQLVFGGLNGLLPCGLVYAACAGATATGGYIGGMQYMLLFGLGTVPMMLGLGLVGRPLQFKLQVHLRKLLPASLGLMASLLILRGLGLGIPYLSPSLNPVAPPESTCCH
jgi:sulfite exporter TauE/SafE